MPRCRRWRSDWSRYLLSRGDSLWKVKWVGCRSLSHQYMVGSYQHAAEFHRAGLYGSLTGEEEVKLTLTFLLDSLFFHGLDGLGMCSVKWVSLGGSPGLHFPNGLGTKGFSFLDEAGASGLSFLDGCRAEGLGFLGRMGADGLGHLDGFCHFGIISAKTHAQLQN